MLFFKIFFLRRTARVQPQKKSIHNLWRVIILCIGVPLLASSCVSSRYLPPEKERLLRQRIKAPSILKKDELYSQLTQKHNRSVIFFPWWLPYVEVYHFGLRHYDKDKYERQIIETKQYLAEKQKTYLSKRVQTRKKKRITRLLRKKKEGNGWMRIGAPLAIYNRKNVADTKQNLHTYMQQRGFFRGTVQVNKVRRKKRVQLTYILATGPAYAIDSVSYHIPNDSLRAALTPNFANHILQKGQRYKQENLEKARKYTHHMLLDNGFFGVEKDYIHFIIDTTNLTEHKLWIQLHVNIPETATPPRRYTLDSIGIRMYPNNLGYPYITQNAGYFFNTKRRTRLLTRRIFMQSGERYSISKQEQTISMLKSMDIFRYVEAAQDTSNQQLQTHIILQPHKKYAVFSETGFEVSQGLPSPFVSVKLRANDFLQTFGILESNFRFSIDGVSGPTQAAQPYKNYTYNAQLSYSYPDILLPYRRSVRAWNTATRKKTTISATYLVNNRQEYTRARGIFRANYTWKYNEKLNCKLYFLDVNFISTNISAVFLEQIRNFYNSFSNSFYPAISSSVSWEVSWNNAYTPFANVAGYQINGTIETGGHFNALYAGIAESRNLQQYQFSRVFITYLQQVPTTRTDKLVWRLHLGVAAPHTGTALPYEKYFFSGGSNSLRAWRPRRIGPGSNPIPQYSDAIEHPGEIILEANLEYRMHIVNNWYGAFFTDIGNVWFTPGTPDGTDNNSIFLWPRSFKDVGIATGVGIRIDFSFFILRTDMAIKAYDPAFPMEDRFLLPRITWKDLFGDKNIALLNFAINYPF